VVPSAGPIDGLARAVDEAILGPPEAADPDRRLGALTDFGGLYIRHRGTLAAHAWRFLSDRHDIDDVVQETFLKLFLAMPEVETEAQALAFARRVLTNLCIDRYRASQRRPSTVDLDLGTADYLLAEDEPVDPVVQAEDAVVVREALARLSTLHREALIKREIEEKPLPVIAAELRVPEESVKHLLFRARRTLRRLLVGTSVDPQTPMTAPEILTAANQRLARAASRSTNVIIALLVAVVAVAVGMRGSSQAPTVSSEAVGPTGPLVAPPADRVPDAGHPGGKTGHHRPAAAAHPAATAAHPPHPVTIVEPPPAQRHPAKHPATPGHDGDGDGEPSSGAGGGDTSAHYVVAGSIHATGPVAIANQERVNHGTTAATSVSLLAAPVGTAHFVMGQALISTATAAPQMQLTPQVQDASGQATQLPVSSVRTSQTLDPDALTYRVLVDATLAVGNSEAAPASLQIDMTYDPSMQHVLAETVSVSDLDLAQPVVPAGPGVDPAAGTGGKVPPSASSSASDDAKAPIRQTAGDGAHPGPIKASDPAEVTSP
jgi:RNA polymerase sigma-70 factor (ECF subfamily)